MLFSSTAVCGNLAPDQGTDGRNESGGQMSNGGISPTAVHHMVEGQQTNPPPIFYHGDYTHLIPINWKSIISMSVLVHFSTILEFLVVDFFIFFDIFQDYSVPDLMKLMHFLRSMANNEAPHLLYGFRVEMLISKVAARHWEFLKDFLSRPLS